MSGYKTTTPSIPLALPTFLLPIYGLPRQTCTEMEIIARDGNEAREMKAKVPNGEGTEIDEKAFL